MKDRIYSLIELQNTGKHVHDVKVDFFDRRNEHDDYEILRIFGDTLAVSMFAEKINTRFHRIELNARMKNLIDSEDLKASGNNTTD